MPTVVLDPPPVELEALIERRRRLGQDLFDEVWDGVLHLNPAPHGRHAKLAQQLAVLLERPARRAGLEAIISPFNLGEAGDYRVADGALQRPGPSELYYPTAALVLEIVSPGDETHAKLGFYAAHHVDEVLIVDPQQRQVRWLRLTEGRYEPVETSELVELSPAELSRQLVWP